MKRKVCILGCGRQGWVIGTTFLQWNYPTTAVDIREDLLEIFPGEKKVLSVESPEIVSFLKDFALVVNALPAKLGMKGIQAALKAQVNVVDITYLEEDLRILEEQVAKAGITVIPDAGVAPGLSHICAGNAFSRLGRLSHLSIFVGGVPKNPSPPYNLCVTFHPEDLLAEYRRKVRIIHHGCLTTVEPLSGLESISFLNRQWECFYTDGLRSLLYTIPAENMEEKTIRYPGHCAWLKNTPDAELKAILEEYSRRTIPDMLLLRVVGRNRQKTRIYEMVDYYDEERKISAMARTTGFTAAVIGKLLLEGKIPTSGLVYPEILGQDETFFSLFLKELRRLGITVNVREQPNFEN
ncbi:MAG: saccharopine dehydrogenase family protein [bacterium JZ-2024 1]